MKSHTIFFSIFNPLVTSFFIEPFTLFFCERVFDETLFSMMSSSSGPPIRRDDPPARPLGGEGPGRVPQGSGRRGSGIEGRVPEGSGRRGSEIEGIGRRGGSHKTTVPPQILRLTQQTLQTHKKRQPIPPHLLLREESFRSDIEDDIEGRDDDLQSEDIDSNFNSHGAGEGKRKKCSPPLAIPLRVVFVFFLWISVTIAVFIAWYVTYDHARDALEETMTVLRRAIIYRVKSEVSKSFVTKMHKQLDCVVNAHTADGVCGTLDQTRWEKMSFLGLNGGKIPTSAQVMVDDSRTFVCLYNSIKLSVQRMFVITRVSL
jgi:hypothetical protein